jgi:hypothetical protein
MGAFGSKDSSSSPERYMERAREVQELPNKILHILFSQTDFKDILALSSIEACPSYIFTTASALETLFQKLDINPLAGKGGEILFAPVSRLAPGIVPQKESSIELVERTKRRNEVCLSVAFFYVRVFQIYAALALTVMNTSPVRRSLYIRQKQTTRKAGPQPAPFMGGAKRRGIREQKEESSKWRTQYYEVLRSPFKVLENYFRFKKTDSTNKTLLHFSAFVSPYGEFDIEWDPTKDTLIGVYTDKKRKVVSPHILVNVEIIKRAGNEEEAVLKFNNTDIITFESSQTQGWIVENENTQEQKDRFFANAIDKFFEEFREALDEGRPIPKTKPTGQAALGPSSSKSPFYAFEDLKKIFETYHKGDPKLSEFPKAYCIARAMTLLNPIFNEERLDASQPFRSSICNKEQDLESLKFMPRAGTYANTNLYFRSLVALSYEGYEYNNKEVNLIQSITSAALLQDISRRLATLYNIPGDEAVRKSFLTSRIAFKDFELCGKQQVTITFLNQEFRKKFQSDIVMPMLKFQEEHNKKVEEILKRLFTMKDGQLKFSTIISKQGISAINEIAHEAFKVLTNYYIKSEAYYLKGIITLQNNRGKDYFTFTT